VRTASNKTSVPTDKIATPFPNRVKADRFRSPNLQYRHIRVLFTIPNLDTAGSGRALFKLATKLNRTKFDVHVMCLHSRGSLFQEFVEYGFKMHVLEYTHAMRPITSGVVHCYRVAAWLRKQQFDVVYSYHYSSDFSEAIAAKLAGCKWVFVKKNMAWAARGWRLRGFLADKIIVQNTDMLRKFYPHSKKASLISIGVDTEEFRPIAEPQYHLLPFPKTRAIKVIGVIANFVPVKGLDVLIKAFSKIRENQGNVQLVLIGDQHNDYGDELLRLVDNFEECRSSIHLVGKQHNINEWLNVIDIYVQPTLATGEGAPISIQEAISSGTLVLGSRVSGIIDQLSPTPELLFEPGDVNSLVNKISEVLLLDRESLKTLREKQKEHLLENYTLNLEVQRIEKELESLSR
jgi:glycosyltransferase involved in cell wall biosynthesis